jgi:hypothetical protein
VHHYIGGRKEVYIALLERLGALKSNVMSNVSPRPISRRYTRARQR